MCFRPWAKGSGEGTRGAGESIGAGAKGAEVPGDGALFCQMEDFDYFCGKISFCPNRGEG